MFCGIVICSSIFVGLFSLYKQDLIEKDYLLTSLNDISLKNKELNKIGIKNRLSLSDKNGMKISSEEDMDGVQDIFDFDVTSNYDEDVYFEIYLSEYLFNNLDSRYVKVYLENRDTGESINLVKGFVPTYYDLLVSSSNSNAAFVGMKFFNLSSLFRSYPILTEYWKPDATEIILLMVASPNLLFDAFVILINTFLECSGMINSNDI